MQKDFHYYCIAVIARAAGFSQEDALTIAYASNYVDDSTESAPIHLDITGNIRFEPVRSAYIGLESFDWSVHKRVYIPFHFLPPKPFNPDEDDTFVLATRPGSEFARKILENAAAETNPRLRLCRIGVALHTYADTWSHQGFSGRKNEMENDVKLIYAYKRKEERWDLLEIESYLFDIAPQIGHAEALYFPDLTYIKWKYTRRKPGGGEEEVERDNVDEFMKATEDIYQFLKRVSGAVPPPEIDWGKIKKKIYSLFFADPVREANVVEKVGHAILRAYYAFDIEERCANWRREFNYLFASSPPGCQFNYDKKEWREKAVEGRVDWDKYSLDDWKREKRRKIKPGFWDSYWVHFHRAALKQRHFVLENMP